jgi:hypothetical protein
LGKDVRFVCKICLVFATIDKNQAGVAVVIPVAFVHGVCPSSTPAEALEVLHIESAHCDVDAGGGHLMGVVVSWRTVEIQLWLRLSKQKGGNRSL